MIEHEAAVYVFPLAPYFTTRAPAPDAPKFVPVSVTVVAGVASVSIDVKPVPLRLAIAGGSYDVVSSEAGAAWPAAVSVHDRPLPTPTTLEQVTTV